LKFGWLDILIHNAGWVAYQSAQELTPDFLQRAININLEAPTWLVSIKELFVSFKELMPRYANFALCTAKV